MAQKPKVSRVWIQLILEQSMKWIMFSALILVSRISLKYLTLSESIWWSSLSWWMSHFRFILMRKQEITSSSSSCLFPVSLLIHPSWANLIFLSLSFLCRPTPKVEWKKKDGSLEETSAQLENHNRWLHFDHITEEDDGEYECRASNSHGSVSHSFTVSVEGRRWKIKDFQQV